MAIAFLLSFVLVRVLISQFQQRLVDLPNERSSHSRPTPRGGGLGFVLSFYAVLGLAAVTGSMSVTGVWFGLIPLVIIGFLDDWKNLPASVRYLVQLSVSGIVVADLGSFPLFPGQSDSLILEAMALILTTIGMTALINFYNFMDGLDGLVAGTAAIQLSFLALWGGNPALWLLVASLLGFLIWNWQPAKIFMGDSGSTFLGAAIAIAILSEAKSANFSWSLLTLTFPIIFDTIYTLLRRLLRRENIFQAHRSHLFQRLHQAGWNHSQVSGLYMVACIGLCLNLESPLGAWAGYLNVIGAALCLVLTERYLQRKSPETLANQPVNSLRL